jgi:hypothetical protein
VLAPSAGKDAASPQDACKDLVGALSLAKRHYQFGITKLVLKGGQVTTANTSCVSCCVVLCRAVSCCVVLCRAVSCVVCRVSCVMCAQKKADGVIV